VTVAALVLAAGSGSRLGHPLPKAFVPLAGRPLVVHSLAAMAAVPEIDRVVAVVAPAELGRFRALDLAGIPAAKLAAPVRGGTERQDSVRAGLAALGGDVELVAVHDAARPLVRAEAVSRAIAVARETGAAILAAPVRDTIKRVEGDRVVETPDRARLWAAQTPQVFRLALLREALAKADAEGFLATDDAQLVERLGAPVRVVPSDPGNLKITHAGDLRAAEAWLAGGCGA
jgi:2-C-methyl-D-erythritol 4-phosphate cytidylyltransferase